MLIPRGFLMSFAKIRIMPVKPVRDEYKIQDWKINELSKEDNFLARNINFKRIKTADVLGRKNNGLLHRCTCRSGCMRNILHYHNPWKLLMYRRNKKHF